MTRSSSRNSAARRFRRRSCARSRRRACSKPCARRGAGRGVSSARWAAQPDPYATDTLLGLIGPVRGGPNRDLLLAVGEMISAAVFAELLTSLGAPAQAMTGGQAGILTDDTYGDARILEVDPRNVLRRTRRRHHPGRDRLSRRNAQRRRHDARPRRQRPDRDRARRRAERRVGRHLHRRQRRDDRRSAPRRRRACRRTRHAGRDGRAGRQRRQSHALQGGRTRARHHDAVRGQGLAQQHRHD